MVENGARILCLNLGSLYAIPFLVNPSNSRSNWLYINIDDVSKIIKKMKSNNDKNTCSIIALIEHESQVTTRQ